MIKKTLSLYQNILDNYIDPLAIFNKQGKIEYGNKLLESYSGYKLNELIGKPLTVLISDRTRNKIDLFFQKEFWKQEKIKNFDIFFSTKNKEKNPTTLSVFPLLDKEGGLAVFLDARRCGFEKISSEFKGEMSKQTEELQKAQEELEEAKEILEIKVKAKTMALRELNETLEEQIILRTKELQERVDELEKWRKLAVGRELKMARLKEEIELLKRN